MCKSNNLIIIRTWSIIRNSVLNKGLLVFPPKLQFQFESLIQVTKNEIFQIIYTYNGL